MPKDRKPKPDDPPNHISPDRASRFMDDDESIDHQIIERKGEEKKKDE
jgi:hypothetical protein